MKILKQIINVQNADMNGNKPTVISLFAGCGGSSLGYKNAGFRELLAIDFNDLCIKTFEMNFPNIPFWKRDISGINGKEILEFIKLKKGELDILDGSPPCQSFSRSGKKRVNDLRGLLVFHFSRLVGEMQPKIFLMENVCGMVEGRSKGIFKELFRDLVGKGYNVRARIMNSKYYGVPQSRDRLIFLGVRLDLDIAPLYPPRQTKLISCQEAIENIDNTGEKIMLPWSKLAEFTDKLKEGRGLDDFFDGAYFNHRKVHHLKPCNTIPACVMLLHYRENRYLTIKELKKLSGFPDDFRLAGGFRQQWKQLGNAVPPGLIEAIACHLRKEILAKV